MYRVLREYLVSIGFNVYSHKTIVTLHSPTLAVHGECILFLLVEPVSKKLSVRKWVENQISSVLKRPTSNFFSATFNFWFSYCLSFAYISRYKISGPGFKARILLTAPICPLQRAAQINMSTQCRGLEYTFP